MTTRSSPESRTACLPSPHRGTRGLLAFPSNDARRIARAARSDKRIGSLAALALVCACGSVQQFRARVLDDAGRPLPGAVVYQETFVPGSPPRHVDFAWAVADADGWAPPRGAAPASVKTASRSCALLAILVPGRLPQVSMSRPPCPSSQGAWERELRVEDAGDHLPYDFRYIGFPFPDDPDLQQKARSPDAAPLRAALRRAAELLQAKERSLGGETLRALDAVEGSR